MAKQEKEVTVPIKGRQLAKIFMMKPSDILAGGASTTSPKMFKTWMYQVKKENRPKPKATK